MRSVPCMGVLHNQYKLETIAPIDIRVGSTYRIVRTNQHASHNLSGAEQADRRACLCSPTGI